MSTLESRREVERSQFRQAAYALLLTLAAAMMLGRILSVSDEKGRVPFLSANDRSRWVTVRALVDHGTYAIDDLSRGSDGWHTIDKVRHPDAQGQWRFYSSKPPLLATLVAGEYALLKQATGLGIAENPFYVGRVLLVVTNLVPWLIALCLLTALIERYGETDLGRIFCVAAAAFGTFLTTMVVTLNNHLPAAVATVVVIYCLARIWLEAERGWGWFAVAGFFAASAAACELPALSLLAFVAVLLLWLAPRETLLAFLPAALVVLAAFFVTNQLAHGSLRPPYMHRGLGTELGRLAGDQAQLEQTAESSDGFTQPFAAELEEILGRSVEASAQLHPKGAGLWTLELAEPENRFALVARGDEIVVHAWDDWYDYGGTYWTDRNRQGIDRGEPSRGVYAAQTLIGHHGFFSLTPLWLLSLLGGGILLIRRDRRWLGILLLGLTLTLICVVFYILRPQIDRNYGGLTSGFRWLYWLIPFWLLALVPAADALARHRVGWGVGLAALGVSVFSAAYSPLNPWRHPWLFDYWQRLGWLGGFE